MSVDTVTYKDFQVTIDSLQKQIQNQSIKNQILGELDKRLNVKVEQLSNLIAIDIEKRHGSKIEQIKKTNKFIVDELLNLDNQ